MKHIITLSAGMAAMMSQSDAYISSFRICAASELPALYQATNAPSLNLDAALLIPPGVQAPALKNFFAHVLANQMPPEQAYYNLVAEYQNLLTHVTNLRLVYNQLIVSGDLIRAMQIFDQIGPLVPMLCYYDSAIKWYNEQKSGQ